MIFGYLAGSYIQQKGKDYPMLCGLFALFHVFLFWLLGWWMDKRKIYIRV